MKINLHKKIQLNLLNITPNFFVKKIIYNIKPDKISNPNYYFELKAYVEVLFLLKKNLNLKNNDLLEFFKDSINVFSEETFNKNTYLKIRSWSIRSGFELTNLLKERYRVNFNNGNAYNKNGEIYKSLSKNGYCKIDSTKKTVEFVKKINKKMLCMPVLREKDGEQGYINDFILKPVPGAYRYFYKEETIPLVECLEILNELNIIEGIETYLGKPILRCVNAWISMPSNVRDDADINSSAQALHNDMDIPSGWVKVFIYLSDVDSDSGPHVYTPTSHKQLPEKLREDRRFKDEEIENEYTQPVELNGIAGTIIVADTIGFHKGKTVTKGIRSILQLEFSTSLIGAETMPVEIDSMENLNELIVNNKRLMHKYIRSSNK